MRIIFIVALVIINIVLAVVLLILFYNRFNLPKEDEGDFEKQITTFDFSRSIGNAMAEGSSSSSSYMFFSNKLYIRTPDKTNKIELSNSEYLELEAEILALVEKHNLHEWNGYDEYLEVLDDSNGFDLRIIYADGKEIVASGSHMFPDNFSEVFKDIGDIFENY